jgi:hypothetical protein
MQPPRLKSPVAWVPDFEIESSGNHHHITSYPQPATPNTRISSTPASWIADFDTALPITPKFNGRVPQRARQQRPDKQSTYLKSWIADLKGVEYASTADQQSVTSSGSVVASLAYSSAAPGAGKTRGGDVNYKRFWTTEDRIRNSSFPGAASRAPTTDDAESLRAWSVAPSGIRFVHPASAVPMRSEVGLNGQTKTE